MTTPTLTDNTDELDKILQSLKYQVVNKQVSEKDWQAEVWFEVTDKARVELVTLITARENAARLDELKRLQTKPQLQTHYTRMFPHSTTSCVANSAVVNRIKALSNTNKDSQ